MKESTSVPIDAGAWDPSGLFVYEMHFRVGEQLKMIEVALPCLLQDAMMLGSKHREICARRPRLGGYMKPQDATGIGQYVIDLSGLSDEVRAHVWRLPKTFLFNPSAGEFWCGSMRINTNDLVYAVGHVPDGHPMRSTGLRMIGLDADDEKSYKPALVRALMSDTGKILVIPTYGAVEAPCAAIDPTVLPQIEGSTFFAFNNVVINTHYTTFVSIHKSTHIDHERLSSVAQSARGLDASGGQT